MFLSCPPWRKTAEFGSSYMDAGASLMNVTWSSLKVSSVTKHSSCTAVLTSPANAHLYEVIL